MKKLLHIGCGKQGVETLPPFDRVGEWRQVRVDIDPAVGPAIVASMTEMAKIESDSIDVIFSKHNLEHLEFHEVALALGEFHRVLKPKGFLICRCPDLAGIAERLATVDLEQALWVSTLDDGTKVEVALIDMIFGARSKIAVGNGFMRHRTGFTRRSLIGHLKRAGFERVDVTRKPTQMELKCTARKVEQGNSFDDVMRELVVAGQHA